MANNPDLRMGQHQVAQGSPCPDTPGVAHARRANRRAGGRTGRGESRARGGRRWR